MITDLPELDDLLKGINDIDLPIGESLEGAIEANRKDEMEKAPVEAETKKTVQTAPIEAQAQEPVPQPLPCPPTWNNCGMSSCTYCKPIGHVTQRGISSASSIATSPIPSMSAQSKGIAVPISSMPSSVPSSTLTCRASQPFARKGSRFWMP